MNDADATVARAVRAALGSIVGAIDAIVERVAAGGRLLYVGAGTVRPARRARRVRVPTDVRHRPEPGRGDHRRRPACDRDTDRGRRGRRRRRAGGHRRGTRRRARCRGRHRLERAHPVRARRDACAHASCGALTVGLSCNDGTALSAAVDHAIEVPVGPEVVAGSTRLKAGTAQKMVLNMISTIVDGAPRQDVRQPDGGPASDERQAPRPGGRHRHQHHGGQSRALQGRARTHRVQRQGSRADGGARRVTRAGTAAAARTRGWSRAADRRSGGRSSRRSSAEEEATSEGARPDLGDVARRDRRGGRRLPPRWRRAPRRRAACRRHALRGRPAGAVGGRAAPGTQRRWQRCASSTR